MRAENNLRRGRQRPSNLRVRAERFHYKPTGRGGNPRAACLHLAAGDIETCSAGKLVSFEQELCGLAGRGEDIEWVRVRQRLGALAIDRPELLDEGWLRVGGHAREQQEDNEAPATPHDCLLDLTAEDHGAASRALSAKTVGVSGIHGSHLIREMA